MNKNARFSFEFFPPKTDKGVEKLKNTQTKLAELDPEFFSVTFGAGGSTRERTLETVIESMKHSGVPTAPHLSCVGSDKASIADLLETYKNEGVRRIVTLRGDKPSGMGSNTGELRYANELVAFIRDQYGDHFHLEVAAYPEIHPEAPSAKDDLQNFKRKVEAGADSAITQYFFNVESFYQFMDECAQMNIDIPIYPGIMPITNYQNLVRFSDNCGADIPRWIRKRMESFGDDQESILKFGHEVVTDMCHKLMEYGVPGLHFYTLNQAEASTAIYKAVANA